MYTIVPPCLITELMPVGLQSLLAGPVGWETLKRGGGIY